MHTRNASLHKSPRAQMFSRNSRKSSSRQASLGSARRVSGDASRKQAKKPRYDAFLASFKTAPPSTADAATADTATSCARFGILGVAAADTHRRDRRCRPPRCSWGRGDPRCGAVSVEATPRHAIDATQRRPGPRRRRDRRRGRRVCGVSPAPQPGERPRHPLRARHVGRRPARRRAGHSISYVEHGP